MEYISSDTNVWIDFNIISRMNLPFLLPYTYIMYSFLLSLGGHYIPNSPFRIESHWPLQSSEILPF